MYPNPVIEKALRRCPGSAAEWLTGGRLGVDAETNVVALALAQERARDLESVLEEFDDTGRNHDYGRYGAVLRGEGLKLKRATTTHEWRREECWFHGDGIETWLGVRPSSAHAAEAVDRAILRYSWTPANSDPDWRIHGSGRVRLLGGSGVGKLVYVSNLDVRLAFRFKLARLRARLLCMALVRRPVTMN